MVAQGFSGKVFAQKERVNAASLHQIIEDATFEDFDQTNMASGAGLVITSSTAPTDTDAIWYYDTLGITLLYDASLASWQPTGGEKLRLTNKSGGGVVIGDIVILDLTTTLSFTTAILNSHLLTNRFLGVAIESISNDAVGVIQLAGIAKVNLDVSSTIGRYLVPSGSTAKIASEAVSGNTGQLGIIMESGSTSPWCLLWGQVST